MIQSSYRTILHKKLAGIQNKTEGSKREHTRCVGYSNEAYDVFDHALALPLEEHCATTQWGHTGQAMREIAIVRDRVRRDENRCCYLIQRYVCKMVSRFSYKG